MARIRRQKGNTFYVKSTYGSRSITSELDNKIYRMFTMFFEVTVPNFRSFELIVPETWYFEESRQVSLVCGKCLLFSYFSGCHFSVITSDIVMKFSEMLKYCM